MSPSGPLSRSSFFRPPLPISCPEPMRLLPGRTWSPEEWNRIQRGHEASDMDSKWDAFVEDDTLFLHRSWTGHGIYELRFTESVGGMRITAGAVETDPGRYGAASEGFDCLMTELVITSVLLGENSPELRARFLHLARQSSEGRNEPARGRVL